MNQKNLAFDRVATVIVLLTDVLAVTFNIKKGTGRYTDMFCSSQTSEMSFYFFLKEMIQNIGG